MGKKANLFVNSLGILSALGIVFGGLFLVQNRLVQEENELLQGGGLVEIQVQSEASTARDVGEEETERALLTDEQLYRVVKKLETEVEAYPHEPWEGQLTMVEAAECGKEWIEKFLLPCMGINDFKLQECSINCYLWAWQQDIDNGDRDPILGYWNVWLDGQDLSANLTLNAATGQVLYASVSSFFLTEYQGQENLMKLLSSYADSFELRGAYTVVDAGEGTADGRRILYQSIGEQGVGAVLQTSEIAVVRADNLYTSEYMTLLNIELRLETD